MRRAVGIGVGLALALAASGGWWWTTRPAPPPTAVVQRGDTLWKLSKTHGVTVDELRAWNGLSGDRIEVGQVLVVGPPGGASATPEDPAASAQRPKRGRRSRAGGGALPPPETAPSAQAWSLPPEEPCLAGPDPDAVGAAGDEAAFAASVGLSHGQVKASMDAFLPGLSRCLTPGEPAVGTLDLEITVACTGRVAAVSVLDDDGLPPALVSCLTGGLRHADFPPHDMPDGYTFGYPMRLSQ